MSPSPEGLSGAARGPAGVVARALEPFARRLGVEIGEFVLLISIVALGAVARLVDLPSRGGWDSDQGTEMLALRNAVTTGQLPTFGPTASAVGGAFHHGALYYDLLLPATWLGNGDPTFVVAEIALLSLLVIPIVWWIARSISGPVAGLTAALLASYSTFIWNPTLVEPGAAIAFLGAWQAWQTRRPWWWLVAAAGSAVAMQAHVAATAIVLPMTIVYLADLRRGPAGRRRGILAWGLAGVTLVAVTYLPLILYEIGHDYAETRGALGYFVGSGSAPAHDPAVRLLFSAIRILAWPLTSWPLVDLKPAFMAALTVAATLGLGLIWRVLATRGNDADAGRGAEREGLRFVGGLLLVMVLALGLGLRSVSEVQDLPTEQYHVVVDPLVLVAAGLVLGGVWQTRRALRGIRLGRLVAAAAITGLLAWNVGRWPPPTAPNNGWPAAHAAAQRLERDAQGDSIAFVALPALKGADAYVYPLTYDGATIASPAEAGTVVVLCDSFWIESGCGDPTAEAVWLGDAAAGSGLSLVERFSPAPDRTLSVYRRTP